MAIKQFAKEGNLILDTHVGSGSSRIACHELRDYNLQDLK
jgi:hypothetical protein